ncbi:Deleted in lung and esophageal cancer protein 1 [Chytriomyces hyalinus]|nr:Deleted in lung and esophageal cancer protein 1 [Chytriomyces hyalinus]
MSTAASTPIQQQQRDKGNSTPHGVPLPPLPSIKTTPPELIIASSQLISPAATIAKDVTMRQLSESMPLLSHKTHAQTTSKTEPDPFSAVFAFKGLSKPLRPLFHSNLELSEAKKGHFKNPTSTAPTKLTNTIEWLQDSFKASQLPKGVSAVFETNLQELEAELQDTVALLQNWATVQTRALESLVGAGSGSGPVVAGPSTGKGNLKVGGSSSTNLRAGGSAANMPNSLNLGVKEKPAKSASPGKGLKGAKGSKSKQNVVVFPEGRDPRTGIIIGSKEVAGLSMRSADATHQFLSDNSAATTETWSRRLGDPNFTLSALHVSDMLAKLAPSEEVLSKLREMSDLKGDWVAKVIQERRDIVDRINALQTRLTDAEKSVAWISEQRHLARSKSLMVETTFSDYAQDGSFRLPALRFLEDEEIIPDETLLQMGAPTLGIFNQVRNPMITRTNNGLQKTWLLKRANMLQVPGLLEMDVREVNLSQSLRLFESSLETLQQEQTPSLGAKAKLRAAQKMKQLSLDERNAKSLRSIGGGIVAIPSTICFTDYQPFQKYTKYLTVKNRSCYSARFRVCIPPPYQYSQFFSVTMITTPSDGDGLIAPGMGCQYRVDFMPQSLANYEQQFLVYTELGVNIQGVSFDPFPVILSGARIAPELTIPDVLHCGPCRSGYVSVKKWKFRNIGGPGRFIIRPQDEQIEAAQIFAAIGLHDTEQSYLTAIQTKSQRNASQEPLSQGPFEISPSFFSLATGETEEITVKLKAAPMDASQSLATRHDETILQIACDNCQVLALPLRANIQIPAVTISSCEPESMRILEESTMDVEGMRFLFGNQNVRAETKLKLTVRNQTRLKMSYYWEAVDNPGVTGMLYSGQEGAGAKSYSDSFKFCPSPGFFGPHADVVFEVSFIPQKVKKYDVIGRLLLRDEDDRVIEQNEGELVTMHSSLFPEKECVLEIFCTGVGLDYVVKPRPEMILAPTISMGQAWESFLKIKNDSISAVTYDFEFRGVDTQVVSPTVLRGETMLIQPGMSLTFPLNFVGLFPGPIDGHLVCKTAGGYGPTLFIPVQGSVELKPGDLDFDAANADFGLISLGNTSIVTLSLINRSSVPLKYSLEARPESESDPWTDDMIISDAHGEIGAGQTKPISITFTPKTCKSFNGFLTCDIIKDTMTCMVTALRMLAKVQTPCASLLHPDANLVCYVNEPFSWSVEIRNDTMLPTQFQWKQKPHVGFFAEFNPTAGELPPGAVVEVSITGTFKQIGEGQTAELECTVDAMLENGGTLIAGVCADVQGLSVHMEVLKDSVATGELSLDFGNDCPIFETRSQTLVVRNRSAIAVQYRAWAEAFPSILVENKEQARQAAALQGTSTSSLILKPTERPNIGFSSETGKKWLENTTAVRRKAQKMQSILREGRGAAFHVSPSTGTLPPFGQVQLKVTSYNNLVGLYSDTLICDLGEWLRKRVPIRLGVDGIPVKFSGAQLAVSKMGCKFERMNFGTVNVQYGQRRPVHPFGMAEHIPGRLITRHTAKPATVEDEQQEETAEFSKKDFLVENQSPRPICLKWTVFTKRHALKSTSAQKAAGFPVPSTSEIDSMLLDELAETDPSTATLLVQPNPLIIPAFKSAPVRLSICASQTGLYKCLVVADIGYVQPDGRITVAPTPTAADQVHTKLGSTSFEENLLAPLKLLEETKAPFPDGIELPRVRKIRLFVQAKAVEPALKLTEDTIATEPGRPAASAILFKKIKFENEAFEEYQLAQSKLERERLEAKQLDIARRKAKALGQHQNSASVFIFSDTVLPKVLDSQLFTSQTPDSSDGARCELDVDPSFFYQSDSFDGEPPYTIITLRNNTETLSKFRIDVSTDAFRVTRVEKPQTPMVNPKRGKCTAGSKPQSKTATPEEVRISQTQHPVRTSVASQVMTGRLPFPAPTTRVSAGSKVSSGASVALVQEEVSSSEGFLTDDLYELYPAETIRVCIQCVDVDVLRSAPGSAARLAQSAPSQKVTFEPSRAAAPNAAEDIRGYFSIMFTNGTVQTIPILCDTSR